MKIKTKKTIKQIQEERFKFFKPLSKRLMSDDLINAEYYRILNQIMHRLWEDIGKGDDLACQQLTIMRRNLTDEDLENMIIIDMAGLCLKNMIEHPEILDSVIKDKDKK